MSSIWQCDSRSHEAIAAGLTCPVVSGGSEVEGFDLLAIGVAAPAMAGPLHIAPNQFGFLFGAALLGAFGLGPIVDRYGRRRVLISVTVMFGVFNPCTASAATLQQILLFRFLAGVGFGGAMPSFISLAEYTRRSNRQAMNWTAVDGGFHSAG